MDTLEFACPEIFTPTRAKRRVVTPRVMVVDDDPAFRELLTEFLWEAGYQVVVATDGWEALRRVDPRVDDGGLESDIDLVMLDMHMPRMSGLQFAGHLRRWALNTPVVAMTAFPDASFYRRSAELGCVAALAKPFSFFELLNYIDELFDR